MRSIEHGTLIDDETARFVAARGAYVVPTMAMIFALVELGRTLGFPAREPGEDEGRATRARSPGMEQDAARRTSRCGFGTDLLGEHVRARVPRVHAAPRGVHAARDPAPGTSVNAEMMQMAGQIGCVAPGAHADLLVVDGDPLADIGVLAADGRNLRAIVRAGEVVKNELS